MLKQRLSLQHAAILAMFGVAAQSTAPAQSNRRSGPIQSSGQALSTSRTSSQRFFGGAFTKADQDALDAAAAKRERKAKALAHRAARGAFRQTATPRA